MDNDKLNNLTKLFYSVKEVSEMFSITPDTLRYWENQFDVIQPVRKARGIRAYRPEDIEGVKAVYYLLKEKKMTVSGAQKMLRDQRDAVYRKSDAIRRLREVRAELKRIIKEFDDMPDSDTDELS